MLNPDLKMAWKSKYRAWLVEWTRGTLILPGNWLRSHPSQPLFVCLVPFFLASCLLGRPSRLTSPTPRTHWLYFPFLTRIREPKPTIKPSFYPLVYCKEVNRRYNVRKYVNS